MSFLKPAWLYFENGLLLEAKAFGNIQTRIGEVVFNTSLNGHQELITDPSYAGKFIVFTMPEIGVIGTNDDDLESPKICASGVVVRNISSYYSSFKSKKSLKDLIVDFDALGICDVDTSYLYGMLKNRNYKMIVSTSINNKQQLKAMLDASLQAKLTDNVSTKKTYTHMQGIWNFKTNKYEYKTSSSDKKVVVLDFGVKRSVLNQLYQSGAIVEVMSSEFDEELLIQRVMDKDVNGIFISNGANDSKELSEYTQKIKKIIDTKVPIFAIGLGHQLVALSFGFASQKNMFSQHGSHYPVLNVANKKIEIVSQNHKYFISREIEDIAYVTHRGLVGDTIEGLKYNDYPIVSIQFEPKADLLNLKSHKLFDNFVKSL